MPWGALQARIPEAGVGNLGGFWGVETPAGLSERLPEPRKNGERRLIQALLYLLGWHLFRIGPFFVEEGGTYFSGGKF
jgi:hypothetical protein